MIRVLLADDQSLVRAGFMALLDARDDIEVVGEASDGASAVELARKLQPDVILMDIRMPGLDGLEATRQIAADRKLAGVRILILTTFGLDEYLFDALRFGASGFLVKDTEPADLATAVRVVAQGDSLISPSMTRRLVAEFASRAKEAPPAAELDAITQREREVMALVADCLTNDEIAQKLYMSPATVRTHVSRAMTTRRTRPRATRRPGLQDGPGASGLAGLTHLAQAVDQGADDEPRAVDRCRGAAGTFLILVAEPWFARGSAVVAARRREEGDSRARRLAARVCLRLRIPAGRDPGSAE